MGGVVTIIIPAYNAEKYVAEAIDSVLAQSYPHVECILVDDGSTDRTAEIVKRYGERVRYIYQDNAERSAARNNGLIHATGEFVSFLDGDDFIAPEKLAEQVTFLMAHPECDVVYSRVKYFTEDDGRGFYSVRRITPVGDILQQLVFMNFITIHAPLIRRSSIDRSGPFDITLSRFEDWEFFLRLAINGARFGFMERFHAFCRIHGENTIGDRARMFEAKWRVSEKIAESFGKELAVRGIDGGLVTAFHQADYGRILVLEGRGREGLRLMADACRLPIPHRGKFLLFTAAARILPASLLVIAQWVTDRVAKYRKERHG